jgi:hypothetical protein
MSRLEPPPPSPPPPEEEDEYIPPPPPEEEEETEVLSTPTTASSSFKVGDNVSHVKLGLGTVKALKGNGKVTDPFDLTILECTNLVRIISQLLS